MTRVAVVLGLLTTSALAESRHLPPGLNAVRVVSGEAVLHLSGSEAPDTYPTLLPEGVYFTAAGYESLESATLKLQDDLAAVNARLAAAECPPALLPKYEVRGWQTRHLVMAGGVGVVAVVLGMLLLGAAR